ALAEFLRPPLLRLGFLLGGDAFLLLRDGLLFRRGEGLSLGVRLVCSLLPAPRQDAEHRQEQRRRDSQERRHPRPPLRPLRQLLPHRRRPRQDRLAAQPALQVVGQRLSTAVAPGRVLLQALQTDRLQVAVGLWVERARPRRLLRPYLQDGVER